MIVLRSYGELAQWGGGPLCLAVGFFDGVHRGHQYLLERLRRQAERLGAKSLAVTFSNSPRLFHQPQTKFQYLTTAEEKLYLLGGLGLDALLMLEYNEGIAKQSAALFLKGLAHGSELAGMTVGYDNSIGSDMLRGIEQFHGLADRLNIDLEFVAQQGEAQHVKSSEARRLVAAGAMHEVQAVLGRPYLVMERVQRGKGKGREYLGIPTANIRLAPEKLAPPAGIYSAIGEAFGRQYPAAICFMSAQQAQSTVLEREGHNPSPEENAGAGQGNVHPPQAGRAAEGRAESMMVEAHLAGFDGDLYGEGLRLSVVSKLRDWIDFDSAEGLRRQMQQDIVDAVADVERFREGQSDADHRL